VRTICAAVLCAAVAGCGVSTPDITVPTVPAGAFAGAGSGDSATFVVDAQTISVSQSGAASISNGGAPQLDHSGPLGCAGRYFTAHLTEHIRIFFRYTARDAWMLIGTGELYHFPTAPKRHHGALLWDRSFPSGRHIAVVVNCPLPRRADTPK
jgi:hypothetical protein